MAAYDFKFADDDRDDECSRDETERHDADPCSCTVFADSIQLVSCTCLERRNWDRRNLARLGSLGRVLSICPATVRSRIDRGGGTAKWKS